VHLVSFILSVVKNKRVQKKKKKKEKLDKMQLYLFLSFLIPTPVVTPAGCSESKSKTPDINTTGKK